MLAGVQHCFANKQEHGANVAITDLMIPKDLGLHAIWHRAHARAGSVQLEDDNRSNR